MRKNVLFLAILISGCTEKNGQDSVTQSSEMSAPDTSAFDSPKLPPSTEGTSVPVNSDPGVAYRLLKKSKMANGNLELLTRRDGPSGTSFARREVDCDQMTYRYLGEGDSIEEARNDSPNLGELSEAMPTSISGEISRFACR